MTVASHVLAFCDTVDLGKVGRLGVEQSIYKVATSTFLKSLIEHAIAQEDMAQELLTEMQKCPIPDVVGLAFALKSGTCNHDPQTWANQIKACCPRPTEDLKELVVLASHYLTHLAIALRNPGGTKTPQESTHLTPNPIRETQIAELLGNATVKRSQQALKELVMARDGYNCPMTDFSFNDPTVYVVPRCSHILPFSLHEQTQTHIAIEAFTGKEITSEDIQANINHPRNALNLQNDVHDFYDSKMAWGIEAIRQPNGRYKYIYRQVREMKPPTMKRSDGDEIQFGKGSLSQKIDLPSPTFCNLRLAVARVLHASGAAEVIDKFEDASETTKCGLPIYFGSPHVSDDVLIERVHLMAFS
ncbi:hypothetical protein K439DRAFT_1659753 [Ramaria rubella]|nr:hypothetical protein K439DRAFT_1659753 [Ramaria rubella]